ncbi:2-phospho-L-lactate guanylyltransferase [Microbacterium sp. NPDC057659]|uniref:2-phospho-L-lactate guanylyltransferase n=1 Tax=Microbacterium sp. NPDC057659 TaxID=3346198 RepID=UPI00366BD556
MIPVKPAAVGKSRLDLPGVRREDMARAIALDTIEAVTGCDRVAQVIVVTRDDETERMLRGLDRVRVAPDPGDGLDAAIALGLASARGDRAVLLGDLPALHPHQLSYALDAAGAFARGFVPDADEVGTCLATARAGAAFEPAFGPDSAALHRARGFVELRLPVSWGLRRDVDTAEHVAVARRWGLGPRTAALVGAALVGSAA